MVFGAMAVSVSAAACSKETIAQPYGAPPNPPREDAGATMVTLYGAPPEPPPTPSSKIEPSAVPQTAIAAPYGAPPMPHPDAGPTKPVK